MTTKHLDVLDRLRAANLVPHDDPTPSLAPVLRRIATPRATRTRRPAARRIAMLAGAAAAAAIAVAIVAASGPSRPGGSAPLGVLQVAAASAQANARAAQFSGYVAETAVRIHAPGVPATTERSWRTIKPISDTEFEGRLESVSSRSGQSPPLSSGDGAQVTRRRVDGQERVGVSWRRPYGTIFNGAVAPGEQPARVPSDPTEAANAVAALAAGTMPGDIDKGFADLLRESAPFALGRTLNYAEDVLTAPRVSPDVRAAVYRALSKVDGIRVDDNATDPAGRPASALIAQIDDKPEHTQVALLFDPDSARVLAERVTFTVDPSANDHRPAGDGPYGEGSQVTTYHYDAS
jgi:hypothetical protein